MQTNERITAILNEYWSQNPMFDYRGYLFKVELSSVCHPANLVTLTTKFEPDDCKTIELMRDLVMINEEHWNFKNENHEDESIARYVINHTIKRVKKFLDSKLK